MCQRCEFGFDHYVPHMKKNMKRRSLIKWFGLGALGMFGGGAAYGTYQPGNSYYQGQKSDHFDGQVFFNPGGIPPRKFTDLHGALGAIGERF